MTFLNFKLIRPNHIGTPVQEGKCAAPTDVTHGLTSRTDRWCAVLDAVVVCTPAAVH